MSWMNELSDPDRDIWKRDWHWAPHWNIDRVDQLVGGEAYLSQYALWHSHIESYPDMYLILWREGVVSFRIKGSDERQPSPFLNDKILSFLSKERQTCTHHIHIDISSDDSPVPPVVVNRDTKITGEVMVHINKTSLKQLFDPTNEIDQPVCEAFEIH